MRDNKNIYLIQFFAIIHAAASLVSGLVGIADDVMLTLLTMLLIVIICLRRKMSILFIMIAVILANLLGFGLGMGLYYLLSFTSLPYNVLHPISTMLCTEILGLGLEFGCRRYSLSQPKPSTPDAKNLRILLVVLVAIIFLRLVILLLSRDDSSQNLVLEIILNYLFSSIGIIFVTEYAIRSRLEAEKAAQEAGLANYRYMKLKQQVNPHFLFNTLNVLDYMILEKTPEEASQYTHRLAQIYRYLIQNEDKRVVSLREELAFAGAFIELLEVRFNTGLEVNIKIPEDSMNYSIVPCSLQLLIENATKHNMVSDSKPLTINIHTTKHSIIISNNINKRISTSSDSTGFGIKYLRQQYKDLADKSVVVTQNDETFTVKLPLL